MTTIIAIVPLPRRIALAAAVTAVICHLALSARAQDKVQATPRNQGIVGPDVPDYRSIAKKVQTSREAHPLVQEPKQHQSAPAGEPPGCNDQVVKDMLVENTYGKAKAEFFSRAAETNDRIKNWKIAVQNVRQVSYDPQSHVRVCAAEFVEVGKLELTETELSVLYWSFALGKKDPSCVGQVSYRIELLLDKPDDFYLTWRCHRQN